MVAHVICFFQLSWIDSNIAPVQFSRSASTITETS